MFFCALTADLNEFLCVALPEGFVLRVLRVLRVHPGPTPRPTSDEAKAEDPLSSALSATFYSGVLHINLLFLTVM